MTSYLTPRNVFLAMFVATTGPIDMLLTKPQCLVTNPA